MNCHSLLKYVLLFLLLVNFAIQSTEAYSYLTINPQLTIFEPIQSIKPSQPAQTDQKPIIHSDPYKGNIVYSSNVLMAWKDTKTQKMKSHSFDNPDFQKLEVLAKTLPSKDFQFLMKRAKNMSTHDFVALIHDSQTKEQILLAQKSINL